MADGATYPARIIHSDGTVVSDGSIVYDSSANQPQPGANPVSSGALANLGSWVSGTAKVNPVAYQITAYVEVAFDGTANAAQCAIAISPDNTTFTTLGTPSVAAAVNTVGAIKLLVPVVLPAGWYIKLTFTATHCTVAASDYA